MNIKKIEQYRAIVKEIEMLENRITKLQKQEYVADAVSGSGSGFPYIKHTIIIKGYDVTKKKKIAEIEERLANRKMELACELAAIEEFIDSVSDSQMRMIFSLRYISGMNWQQVAMHIGGGNTAESIRKKNYRFFKKK